MKNLKKLKRHQKGFRFLNKHKYRIGFARWIPTYPFSKYILVAGEEMINPFYTHQSLIPDE